MLLLFLALASLGIAFSIARINILISPVIVFFVIGSAATIIIFSDYRWGFYGGLVLTSIMFYFERIFPFTFPYGVVCELLFVLGFVSLLFDPKQRQWREYLTHPISIGYLLIFGYQLFQIFNPNAVSLAGWLLSLRALVFPLIMITGLALAGNLSGIKMLVKIWLMIATAAAIYGIYQEIFGLTGFEMNWVTADPLRFGLYFILGHMRKFSFLSDPSSFGVFMAYSALAAFCLLFSPLSKERKLILGICMVLMIVSMLYSGTRTAFAMLVVGIVFFILISIRKKATFVVAFLLVMVVSLIMVGPFSGRYINRLRSAFKPSEDASMEVRDVKRILWQPYILSHPIGGGLNTTGSTGVKYSAGHPLAGGWDADSGYLKVALEQGWIGLSILMVFFSMVMVKGINNYFNLTNPMMQSFNLAFLVPLFAVSVGNFTQNAIYYKPLFIFVIVTYSVFIRIGNLKYKSEEL